MNTSTNSHRQAPGPTDAASAAGTGVDHVAPAGEGALKSLGRAVGEAVLGGPHSDAPHPPHEGPATSTPPRVTRLADLPPAPVRRR